MTAAAAVGRESGMTQKSNLLEMSALCVLFILLSLWGIIWDFTSGLLTSGIDGIMLLAICLMMGGIFSLMLVVMLWQAGLIPIFQPKAKEGKAAASAKPAVAAKSATPAPAASPAPAPASAAAPAAPAPAPAQKAVPPAQTTPTTK
jgi:predicted lipid-binding transport protein (Tim44 family)